VRHILDLALTLFSNRFTILFLVNGAFFLALHPFDVSNLMTLHFKVVATFPVLLTALVLLAKKFTQLSA